MMANATQSIGRQLEGLVDAVLDPESLFGAIANGLRSWTPAVVLAIGTPIVAYLTLLPFLEMLPRDTSLGLSEQQLEQGTEFLRRYKLMMAELTPILLSAKWAFLALLIWMSCLMLESFLPYGKVFALVVYASVVPFLHEAVKLGLVLLREGRASGVRDLAPKTGLNLLFPDVGGAAGSVLTSINPFDLWFFALLALGIRALGSLRLSRAAIAVLPAWLSVVALQAALAALGARGVPR